MWLELTLMRLDKLFRVFRHPDLLKALVRYRVLAGVEHRTILEPGLHTVVDIGANRGQFALAARQFCPLARVYSFEPLPEPTKVFRAVFLGDERVVVHQAAIGPEVEQREMHISERDDSSSLLPIDSLQSRIFPGTREVSTIEVRVGPLDSFLKVSDIISPAMLKLDVQGFEYEALCGCESLLSLFDKVYCECSFVELYSGQKLAADVIAWLSGKGFNLCGIFNAHYDTQGQPIQADFLFLRKTSFGVGPSRMNLDKPE